MQLWQTGIMEGDKNRVYPYKAILLVSIVIRYSIQQYINYRQLKRTLVTQMPKEVQQLGTRYEQFILSQAYAVDKLTFQMLCLSIKTCLQCLLIMTNVRPFIWDNMDKIFPFIDMGSQTQKAIGYILIYMFISKAFMVPLQAYQMQIIDKKHKKVTKTLYSYFFGLIIQGILTLVPIIPIIIGYLRVVDIGGDLFYLFLQIFILVVTIIYAQIYPYIKIFLNRFNEITNQELLLKINRLAIKTGFPVKGIKIKSYKQYDMHQAQYHGIGNKHFIAICQSLFAKLNSEQVTAVLSHQIGHWRYKHSLKALLLYLNLSLFYIYSFFVHNEGVFKSFGFSQKSVFVGTALFYDLHTPIISVFQYFSLAMKRMFQFQSDLHAVKMGYGPQLRNALIKLYKDITPKIRPDRFYSLTNLTHPSLYERLQYIEKQIQLQARNTKIWLQK